MVLKELNPRSRPEAEEQTAAGRPAVGPGEGGQVHFLPGNEIEKGVRFTFSADETDEKGVRFTSPPFEGESDPILHSRHIRTSALPQARFSVEFLPRER